MVSSNDHIRAYLDYYTALPIPPQFAILISGRWGSGKTWLIKDYFSKYSGDDQRHLFVSLNGVNSVRDIEFLFFEQLHPRLAKKRVKIAAKIAQYVINAASNRTVGVSVDGAVSPDVLMSLFTNTKGYVLVFDDLERCPIPLVEVLGYINQHVEHRGYKVVIIANESELDERKGDTQGPQYRRIKEKLVGKTFRAIPDLDHAIRAFMNALGDGRAKRFLLQNTDVVADVYSSSEYENLRIIRHAMLDFARICAVLAEHHLAETDLMRLLLAQFIVYSFEIQMGVLRPNALDQVRNDYFSAMAARVQLNANVAQPHGDESAQSPGFGIVQKYPAADMASPLVPEDVWQRFFEYGLIDGPQLNNALTGCYYYHDRNTPNWRRLLNLWGLTVAEFREVLASVRIEYRDRQYAECGIVKHVAGMLLWLSVNGVIPDTIDSIVSDAKAYIDDLKRLGRLNDNVDRFGRFFEDDSFDGVAFWGRGIVEFDALCLYVRQKTAEALADALPTVGRELLDVMASDSGLFARRLLLTNSADNLYYNRPVLAHIEPATFVEQLLALHPSKWRHVARVLRERYSHEAFAGELLGELPWLREVQRILSEHVTADLDALDRFRIESLVRDHIVVGIASLSRLADADAN